MDIDKMIADYSSSLMSQAKKWQKQGLVSVPEEKAVEITEESAVEVSEEVANEVVTVPSQPQETEASAEYKEKEATFTIEFCARVFSGPYPVEGAKVAVKKRDELIYLLTTRENGETERVVLSGLEEADYRADIFAEGFEGKRDIPVEIQGDEAILSVSLTPLPYEED